MIGVWSFLNNKSIKGQTSMEASVAFLISVSLFLGAIGMWSWLTWQIAKRQPEYNSNPTKGRVEAGKPNRNAGEGGNKQYIWEKKVGDGVVNEVYQRKDLTKEDVHYRAF